MPNVDVRRGLTLPSSIPSHPDQRGEQNRLPFRITRKVGILIRPKEGLK
jgi:hypothetical protein